MKRIGIFAGAFDPIHDGHLEVARTAVDQLELDLLVFLVEKHPWGDKRPIDIRHRIEMIRMSIKQDEKMIIETEIDDKFYIDTTLPALEQMFPGDELFFILGADIFLKMNRQQWPNLEKMFKHYVVVFERGVMTEKKISEHARNLGIATAIIPSALPHHSSTDVRLQTENKAIWVPKQVANYIHENNLYE